MTAVFARKFQVNTIAVGNGTVTPPSDLFLEGSEVEFTAAPDPNWAFERWSGDLPGGVDRYIEATSTQIERAMNVYAHFIERPGLTDLDTVGDLNYFLQAVGESATAATFDRNGIDYDSGLNRIYVGNGMPDAAELYLLETILKTYRLDLSYKSGAVHDPVWEAWRTNLARAEIDLSGYDARIIRIVAGYMTLGDFDTVEGICSLVEGALTGVTIDVVEYDLWPQRYLKANQDADHDSFTNLDEWHIASPSGSLDDLAAFSQAAINGQAPEGETPPVLVPTGCENDACLDRGYIYATPASIFVPTPGDSSATCSPVGEGYAIGTAFRASVIPDTEQGYGFTGWYSVTGNCMISGSREPVEEDVIQGDVDLRGFFTRQTMEVPRNGLIQIKLEPQGGAIVTEDAEGDRTIYGPPGSYVRLSAVSTDPDSVVVGWEIKAGPTGVNPKYSRESSVTVPVGAYARPLVSTYVVEPERIQLPAAKGGVVLASECYQWGGAFLDSLAAYSASLVDFAAVPNPGWEFVEWQIVSDPPTTSTVPILHSIAANTVDSATATFRLQAECTLEILVESNDSSDPRCVGYVMVDPAKRYYLPTDDQVELTAVPNAGYEFLWWEGTWMPSTAQNPLHLNVAEYFINRQVRAVFLAEEGVIDTQSCVKCVHHGLPNDEGWLENDVSLPNTGTGYTVYIAEGETPDTEDWGCRGWTIAKIIAVGAAWNRIPRAQIGDISLQGGGYFHKSSHQNGLDVDVRYVRNDDNEGPLNITTSRSLYDQAATQVLVNLFLAEGATMIIANSTSGLSGVTDDVEHEDHLHVRFADPDGLDN